VVLRPQQEVLPLQLVERVLPREVEQLLARLEEVLMAEVQLLEVLLLEQVVLLRELEVQV